MKSLYESILSSTHTGGVAFVEKWCKEHISRDIRGNCDDIAYKILPDLKIVNKPPHNLCLHGVHKKIPSAIKFGDITGNFFIKDALNYMDASQLPSFVDTLFVDGEIGVIPPFKMKCCFFTVISRTKYLKKIEPIELEMKANGSGDYNKPIIHLASTNIDIDSLKNITVKGEIHSIDIQDTPAAKTIQKYFQEHRTKKLKSGDCPECKDFLDDIFGSYEGLECIRFHHLTRLEFDKNLNMWFLM